MVEVEGTEFSDVQDLSVMYRTLKTSAGSFFLDAERGKDPECSAIHGMYFSFRNTHRFQSLVEVDVHLSFLVQVEGTQSNDVQDL